MPTRRQALASLMLAGALPQARAQHVVRLWPAGRARPALTAADLDGKAWDLAHLHGRAVLIHFWATWCAHCKEEMPTLQTLAELEGEHLAVNVREPLPRIRRYVQSAGLTLTVLPDPQGEITGAWAIKVFPTTVLIDAHGKARQLISGAVDWTSDPALNWIKALRG